MKAKQALRDFFTRFSKVLCSKFEINHFETGTLELLSLEAFELCFRFISIARTCANRPDPPKTKIFDNHQSDVFVYRNKSLLYFSSLITISPQYKQSQQAVFEHTILPYQIHCVSMDLSFVFENQ